METVKPSAHLASTRTLRKPYRADERRGVLRGAGLPDTVQPYGIDDAGDVVSGGQGTAMVRQCVLTSFIIPFEQCINLGISDPTQAFNKFPAYREVKKPETFRAVFERFLSDRLTPAEAAERLESASRLDEPVLQPWAPQLQPAHEVNSPGRPRTPDAHKLRARELHKVMPWKDVAATLSAETKTEYSAEACRGMMRVKRAK